jgi:predicted nucleic acid-binding protein
MGLLDDLGPGPVAIDTAIVIYFIEEDSRFLPLVRPIFVAADEGRLELVTSAPTLMEVLVMPCRAGNAALAERYEGLLARGRGIRLIDITLGVLRNAAQLRAVTGIRTPDALQLAAALSAGCSAFVTNDRRLPSLPNMRVLQLNAYST